MLSSLRGPADLLESPTRELAAISLRQIWRENGFLLHLSGWLATSVFLVAVNFLTTGLGRPWCLWPIAALGAVVLFHGYLALLQGRRRYSAEHRLAARQGRADEPGGAEKSASVELRTKLLGLLSSAREVLRGAAPEITADLSRAETHALTALAWLEATEGMLSRGEKSADLRREAVELLSRSGLGSARGALETLRSEIDRHDAALAALEQKVSSRQSILGSFALALESAIAAKDRGDLLAAVTGPIRDRVTLLESAVVTESETPEEASPTADATTDRIREEVRLARQLQQSILPKEAPRIPGLSVSHLYQPSSEVGGDFYDFYSLDSDRLLVALGDASGHGLDSSMVSSMAKSALYTHVSSGRDLADTMVEMNRMMWDTLGKQRLMTLSLMEIDVKARRLSWINAGQVFPLLRGAAGVRELEAPSYPLGVRREASYEVRHEQLAAGDVLLIFTDGYVEALDPAGEPFGWERLGDRLWELDGGDTDRIVDELSEALHQHLGRDQPQDDVTLIAIGIEP